MAFREFFTIPDPDIIQETSVDPMGLQVIWTYYGQAIFDEKLTTIANDLRVFTFNLFHHHLIRKLFEEYPEEIAKARKQYSKWQTDSDIKSGILMFLEDLVTHIFYLSEENNRNNVENIGILGLTKARKEHNNNNAEEIFLSAYRFAGLLKNQINLGMTGRYKGPMIKMKFFNRSFSYMPETWERIESTYKSWNEALELEEVITKIIISQLFKSRHKEYPRISLHELKIIKSWNLVKDGYLKCFKARKFPKSIREFWYDILGLNSGAPSVLIKLISQLKDNVIPHKDIISKAIEQLLNEVAEQAKLDSILQVEPLLSHSEFLLRFLADKNMKPLHEINNDLITLRNEIRIAAEFNIKEIHPRLQKLRTVMLYDGQMNDWLIGVLAYHKDIMVQRGGGIWVDFDQSKNLKHLFAPQLNDSLNTIAKYLELRPWLHTYYLEALRSIYNSLN